MNLIKVSSLANGPMIGLIRWLQAQHLLADPLRKLPCNQAMSLIKRNRGHVDGYMWLVCVRLSTVIQLLLIAKFRDKLHPIAESSNPTYSIL